MDLKGIKLTGNISCENLLRLGILDEEDNKKLKFTVKYERYLSNKFSLSNQQYRFIEKYLYIVRNIGNKEEVFLIKDFNNPKEYNYKLGNKIGIERGNVVYENVGDSFGTDNLNKRTVDSLIDRGIFVKIIGLKNIICYKYLSKEGELI